MKRIFVISFALATTLLGQVSRYGTSTPPNLAASLTSRGQIPFAGNQNFVIALRYTPNLFGAVLAVSPNTANIPLTFTTLLVDPFGIMLIDMPPGIDSYPVPIPALPNIAGLTAHAQAAVVDPIVPWGYGFTAGFSVTVLPDSTPQRAWIPGEDLSTTGSTIATLASLDLSVWPPVFRACGVLGSTSIPYSPKIAVATTPGRAYAHGNGSNASINIYDVSSDPIGILPWAMIGSIPLVLPVDAAPGQRDLTVNRAGTRLFATSGAGTPGSNCRLDAFDITQNPATPLQSIPFPGAGGGCMTLDFASTESRLALLVGNDAFPSLNIYSVSATGPTPLTLLGAVPLPGFVGDPTPNDVQFSQDACIVFVTGANGGFAVVSVDSMTVVAAGTFAAGPNGTGCAVVEAQGTPIAVLADVATPGKFHIFDINPESAAFGVSLGSVIFPSLSLGCARLVGRQDTVVGVESDAGFPDCQFIECVTFSTGLLTPSYARIQMPSLSALLPLGTSARAHSFDLR